MDSPRRQMGICASNPPPRCKVDYSTPVRFGQSSPIEIIGDLSRFFHRCHHAQGQVKIDKEEWQDSMLTFAFTTQGKQVTGTLKILKDEFIIDKFKSKLEAKDNKLVENII